MTKTRARHHALISAILLLICTATFAAEKPVILLTGFEPFGGLAMNASWETVKKFQGQEIGGYRIETALLPVVYDEMAAPLEEALKKHKPAIAISFGVGTRVIQIETIARNSYHPANPKDNKDKAPPRTQILPLAAAEEPTKLPVKKIVAALAAGKIGVSTSKDAGGYLCNECFYRLMRAETTAAVRGFVHVPDFGTQDPAGGVFDAEKLKAAVRIIVETTVAASKQ